MREPVAQRGQLGHDAVHVRVDARHELNHRRVRLGERAGREIVRELPEDLVA